MPAASLNLIPYPEKIILLSGIFLIADNLVIDPDPECLPTAKYLHDALLKEYSLEIPILHTNSGCAISLQIDASSVNMESYTLKVLADGIRLTSGSTQGIFRGVQTLLQLIHQFRGQRILPCVLIEDSARFAWRGLMLDEARHFQGAAQVKRLLDIMARLKMNMFHWHLTDDQGWRIEIKSYPRLTETGSRRAGTSYHFLQKSHNHIPYSGCYTQTEIHDVVAYAAERYITVVPEIEFPGHATAALAAYPEYTCSGSPLEVATGWGIFPNLYCPGKPQTLDFLQNILGEIVDLFPGQYVHLGGDEAPKSRWKRCPQCRSKAAELGIGIPALQTWFTNRLAEYLRANDKRAIGWSEILGEGLDGDLILQHWLPQRKNLRKALQQKRSVILSPYLDVYLDHTYDLISLRHVYEFDPIPQWMEETGAHTILGLEAPLWSEYVWNADRLDYQLFPRLMACAETGWTFAERKEYSEFERRLKGMIPWLESGKIAYAPQQVWDTPKSTRWAAMTRIGQVKRHTQKGELSLPE